MQDSVRQVHDDAPEGFDTLAVFDVQVRVAADGVGMIEMVAHRLCQHTEVDFSEAGT